MLSQEKVVLSISEQQYTLFLILIAQYMQLTGQAKADQGRQAYLQYWEVGGLSQSMAEAYLQPTHEVNSPVTHQVSYYPGKEAGHDTVGWLWPRGRREQDD